MVDLFLVHFDFFGFNCQLLAHCIGTLPANFAHLAIFQKTLQLSNPFFESHVFFIHDHLLLTDSEKLGLNMVELVSQSL